VKTEGYDGKDSDEEGIQSQWNFSGALLYSVTIITTIGQQYTVKNAVELLDVPSRNTFSYVEYNSTVEILFS